MLTANTCVSAVANALFASRTHTSPKGVSKEMQSDKTVESIDSDVCNFSVIEKAQSN